MTFESFIDELRARPEQERMAIAGFSAALVAAVLFIIWIVAATFGGAPANSAANQPAAVSESLNDMRGEVESARASFESQYDELRRALSGEAYPPAPASSGREVIELYADEDGTVHSRTVVEEEEE